MEKREEKFNLKEGRENEGKKKIREEPKLKIGKKQNEERGRDKPREIEKERGEVAWGRGKRRKIRKKIEGWFSEIGKQEKNK